MMTNQDELARMLSTIARWGQSGPMGPMASMLRTVLANTKTTSPERMERIQAVYRSVARLYV